MDISPELKQHIDAIIKAAQPRHLCGFFKTYEDYKFITDLLIRKGWVSVDPKISYFTFRPDYNLRQLFELLQHLEERKYFTRTPKRAEYAAIARSTFHIETSGASVNTLPKNLIKNKKHLPRYLADLEIPYSTS